MMNELEINDLTMKSLHKEQIKCLINGRKLHQRFLPLFGITGIILTAADMVSDIVLAVDYCVTDNPWWCGLTWIFIFTPMLALIPFMYINNFAYHNVKWKWTIWKILQTSFESAPQLLLQLIIIALSPAKPGFALGNVSLNLS